MKNQPHSHKSRLATKISGQISLFSLVIVLVMACGMPVSVTPANTPIASTDTRSSVPATAIASPEITGLPDNLTATLEMPLPLLPTETAAPPPTDTPTNTPTDTLTPEPTATDIPTETPLPTPPPEIIPDITVRFAVIGDYGLDGLPLENVSNLIKSWDPDFIITTGDNNYPSGEADTIDENIGQYFHEYIAPYQGRYGEGAAFNRFFPTLGNHDYETPGAQPYFDYFVLPGNERYYDFSWGPVHFFALNSDPNEPDGVGRSSAQAAWLLGSMAVAPEPWKIVYMHHAPYTSGEHGNTDWIQWPFRDWGADAVISGHDHSYERLNIGDLPYFVNGLGGGPRYNISRDISGSESQYDSDYGAMLVTATIEWITFEFINIDGEVIDRLTIEAVTLDEEVLLPLVMAYR
ncbi:MAG: hypothetical protein EHM70_10850 [Chloroflexota bacterium]|nr:MAG: hypothetical protein EHM70_10850 [Chloroflexota bacterium]